MTDRPDTPGGAIAPALPAPPLARRMAAWLYEGVLMFGVVVPAGLLFSVATQMRHGLQHRAGLIAFLFAVLALYFTWFWTRGQTLAMKTWHTRLVDVHGGRVSAGRALLRYVLCWVWFLPPLLWLKFHPAGSGWTVVGATLAWVAAWALLSRLHPQRQFLHDVAAGTRLVSAPPAPPRR